VRVNGAAEEEFGAGVDEFEAHWESDFIVRRVPLPPCV
jgi:hypothetical protein